MDELLSIKEILLRLEKLLYGHNFECHFQFELVVESTDVTVAMKASPKTVAIINRV